MSQALGLTIAIIIISAFAGRTAPKVVLILLLKTTEIAGLSNGDKYDRLLPEVKRRLLLLRNKSLSQSKGRKLSQSKGRKHKLSSSKGRKLKLSLSKVGIKHKPK